MKPAAPPLTAAEIERVYDAYFAGDGTLPHCNAALARAFVADVAAASPPAQKATIEHSLLPLMENEAAAAERKAALLSLARIARDAGFAGAFAGHDARVIAGPLHPFIEDVNGGPADTRTVVFVAMMPYFVILREAIALRRRGYRAFLLSLSPLPAHLRRLFEDHFDGLADTQQGLRLMRTLLGRLHPDVFHVQCWMWTYVLGRLAIDNRGRAAVVCEFYDITSLYAERADLCLKWPAAMVDFDLAMERTILQGADGIVTRFPEEVCQEWAAEHGVDAPPPAIEMQAWPCPPFAADADTPVPARADGPLRLVYAGGLVPADAEHPPELFPEVGMPRAFASLLGQGLAIDVLSNPQTSIDPDHPQYGAFAALARDHDTFRMRDGVPPDQLSGVLAAYDFGLLLFDFDLETSRMRDIQRKNVMATKVFAYIEAGLPVIVNAEYERMAALVEDDGLGLGLHSSEIENAAHRLAAFDTAKARANLRRFNAEHAMDHEIAALIDLYDRAMAAAGEQR